MPAAPHTTWSIVRSACLASVVAACAPIGLDRAGRVDVAALEAAIDADIAAGCTPIAVVGSAGDVNTGLVDPLRDLARIARERDTWFHVDGAYGGFGLLDDRVRDRYGDVSDYDSFAVDPHKWLAAPVGTGAIIIRDASILARAFTIEPGDYDAGRASSDIDRRPWLPIRRAGPWHARAGCRLLDAGTGRRRMGSAAGDRRRWDACASHATP